MNSRGNRGGHYPRPHPQHHSRPQYINGNPNSNSYSLNQGNPTSGHVQPHPYIFMQQCIPSQIVYLSSGTGISPPPGMGTPTTIVQNLGMTQQIAINYPQQSPALLNVPVSTFAIHSGVVASGSHAGSVTQQRDKKMLDIINPENNERVHIPKDEPDLKKMEHDKFTTAFKDQVKDLLAKSSDKEEQDSAEAHSLMSSQQETTLSDWAQTAPNEETVGDTDDTNSKSAPVDDTDMGDATNNLETLEQQIGEMMKEMTQDNNPSELVYGKEFMMTMREYVKGAEYVCKWKGLLIKLDLDISKAIPRQSKQTATPPKQERQKKFTDGSQFKPGWQTNEDSSTGMACPPKQRFQQERQQFIGVSGSRFSTHQKPMYGGRKSDSGRRNAPMNYAGRQSFDRQHQHRTQSPLAVGGPPNQRESTPTPTVSASKDSEGSEEPKKKAWKPLRRTMEGATEEEQRHEKLKMQLRGILNKITPSTYDELTDDFCSYKVYEDAKLLPKIIDLIFEKAVEEPHFCALYADLCFKQVTKEIEETKAKEAEEKKARRKEGEDSEEGKIEEAKGKKDFKDALILKCQKTFESKESDLKIAELRAKVGDMKNEEERKALEDEVEQLRSKEKRRLLGVIRLIACLFQKKLLTMMIILWCVVELIQMGNQDEFYIEFTIGLLEKIGEKYQNEVKNEKYQSELKRGGVELRKKEQEQRTKKEPKSYAATMQSDKASESEPAQLPEWRKNELRMEKIFQHLSDYKSGVSTRTRFLILGLEELRDRNWVPRCADKGPKTIDEIREQAQKEQAEADAERHMYEQKKEEEREKAQQSRYPHQYRSGGENRYQQERRQQPKQFYPGRHSLQDQHRRSTAPSHSSAAVVQPKDREPPPQSRIKADLSRLDEMQPTAGRRGWVNNPLGWGQKKQQEGAEEASSQSWRKEDTKKGEDDGLPALPAVPAKGTTDNQAQTSSNSAGGLILLKRGQNAPDGNVQDKGESTASK